MIQQVEGRVFEDFGRDGLTSDDIPFQDGVTISLFRDNGDGQLDFETDRFSAQVNGVTDRFRFEVPQDGCYFVVATYEGGEVVTPTIGTGGYALRVVGQQVELFDPTDRAATRLDFGFVRTSASISGQAWHDRNRNGQVDFGEPELAGFTMYVDVNENNRFDPGEPSDVSDGEGNYVIADVPPGNYRIGQVPREGWQLVSPGLTFARSVVIETGRPDVRSLTTSAVPMDVNRDGLLDLVATTEDINVVSTGPAVIGGLSVLVNQGSGTFQLEQTHTLGSRPRALVAADLSGDGKEELIVVDVGTPRGSIDQGSLVIVAIDDQLAIQKNTLPASADGPIDIVAEDLDGDGDMDLAAVGFRNNATQVFWNDDGAFHRSTFLATGAQPIAIDVDDVDLDGDADIVVTSFREANDSVVAMIWHGDGEGGFLRASNQLGAPLRRGGGGAAAVTGDFNRDGLVDLALAHYLSDEVSVRFGVVDGGFGVPQVIPLGSQFRPIGIDLADLDADSFPEILVTGNESDRVVILDPLREASPSIRAVVGTAKSPQDVLAVDLDGDQRTDLAAVSLLDGIQVHLANGLVCDVAVPTAGERAQCNFGLDKVEQFEANGLVFFDQNSNGIRDEYDLASSEFIVALDRSASTNSVVGSRSLFSLMQEAVIAFSQSMRRDFPDAPPRITLVSFDDGVSVPVYRERASELFENRVRALLEPIDEVGTGTDFLGAVGEMNQLLSCDNFQSSTHVVVLSDGFNAREGESIPAIERESVLLRQLAATISTFSPGVGSVGFEHSPTLSAMEGRQPPVRRSLESVEDWLAEVLPASGRLLEPGMADVEVLLDGNVALSTASNDPATPLVDERGTLSVDGLRRGRHTLVVDPPSGTLPAVPTRIIEVGTQGPVPTFEFAQQPINAPDAPLGVTCGSPSVPARTTVATEAILDVNRDGNVNSLDALVVINTLNGVGSSDLVWADVDFDGMVTPYDAIQVVNFLNNAGTV